MKKTAIVYENDEILILHKAAGVAVQGGEGVAHPLDQALSEELGYKVHLVHRLDKDTSGLLVVAKNAAAAAKWISLIQSKQVKKEYTALCFGTPVINGKEMERGTISDAVTKGSRTLNAVTHFSVTRTIHLTAPHAAASAEQAADNTGAGSADTGSTRAGNTGAEPLVLTELHLVLGTGRMHQIRIHLAKAHCPIAK